MSNPVYIVADDHPLVLEGVKGVLFDMEPNCEVLEATNYGEILELLNRDLDFSLIIADLKMPDIKPDDAIKAIQEKRPDIPVLIISATQNPHVIQKTMELGVSGYMFKSFSHPEMVKAIQTVMDGEIFVPQAKDDFENDDASISSDIMEFLGAATLNKLPLGLIILNEHAKVLFKNDAASFILDLKDGIYEDIKGLLRSSNTDQTRYLHSLISGATRRSDDEREGGALSIDRPSMKRAFSLMIMPLTVQDYFQFNQHTVAIFINDPEKPFEPPTQILARLYNLTDAEARLLQALIVGKKLERVATDFGVSVNTLRSHLKQVFRKTNTNRQSELVSLVLNSSIYMTNTSVDTEN